MKHKMRGQFTIIALLMAFVGIIVLAVITPTVQSVIEPLLNGSVANVTDTTKSIISLIPTMMWLGLMISVLIYIMPQRD